MTTLDKNSPEDLIIAEKLFGWRWMSFASTPVREDSRYPKECRVRQFFSPAVASQERWVNYFATHRGRPAKGDEALAYCYSSRGGDPEHVPCYTSDQEADLLVLERVEELWGESSDERLDFNEALRAAGEYEPGDYSRAALKVIGDE